MLMWTACSYSWTSTSNMHLSKFFNKIHTHQSSRSESVKTHPHWLPQKPLTVSGNSIRVSAFPWATSLPADFAWIQCRNLRIPCPTLIHQSSIALLPKGYKFLHMDSGSGSNGHNTQGPGHMTGRNAPWSCFWQSRGYWHNAGTLGCGFEWPTWLVWCGW
jgi:hypothetical protein